MILRNVDLNGKFFNNHVLINFLPKREGSKGPRLKVTLQNGVTHSGCYLISIGVKVVFDKFECSRQEICTIEWS